MRLYQHTDWAARFARLLTFSASAYLVVRIGMGLVWGAVADPALSACTW
ncbi:MAG: hypothetical protein ABIL09_08425 [Gemmatimonadota bacterium]